VISSDKEIELFRYEQRALSCDVSHAIPGATPGDVSMPLYLRAPYIKYEQYLSNVLSSSDDALELCAGMGENSSSLITSGCSLVSTDISPHSLAVLRSRFPSAQNLTTIVCDIEDLPFTKHSFDVVACAGGLSYGDNQRVLQHIYRVLKPGGYFICVDSLNHNPIYRANRFFHYLRRKRTLSTLKRMPTTSLIRSYQRTFLTVSCEYFGSFTWLMPLVAHFLGDTIASNLSDFLDRIIVTKKHAFKFVLIAHKSPHHD